MHYPTTHPDLYNGDQKKIIELYSAACSLSDMEIFLFPDLLYSLLLAEIMSPRLWAWREDPWFDGIRALPPLKRIQRLKQYIMDNYTFNLDLDTWGLTTKEKEIARFSPFIAAEELEKSNALFGYEGDKYYFTIDIRRHFGLDKYDSSVIPYWKTETLEAMDAFRYKPDWETGGGECVSLSVLYAAAMFVVAGIPLEDINLLATPLHSQNFVDLEDGLLTNNRRIVTKTMFFNGTELSNKARRALENEQITVLCNRGRYIHSLYEEATLPLDEVTRISEKLQQYLKIKFTPELLGNFLRCHPEFQPCFSYRLQFHKKNYYVGAETAFRYEAGSKLKLSDRSRKKLLGQICQDECYPEKLPGKLVINDLESFIRDNRIDLESCEDKEALHQQFCGECEKTCDIIESLYDFVHVEPKLPVTTGKRFVEAPVIDLHPGMDREAVINSLSALRSHSLPADLSFHAARVPEGDLAPWWKAALERNPVCLEALAGKSPSEATAILKTLLADSIYDGDRIAQPDEVWNFGTGDGFEKAVVLVNLIHHQGEKVALQIRNGTAIVKSGEESWRFPTIKTLPHVPETEVYPGFMYTSG